MEIGNIIKHQQNINHSYRNEKDQFLRKKCKTVWNLLTLGCGQSPDTNQPLSPVWYVPYFMT